jgi:hypothetical protein
MKWHILIHFTAIAAIADNFFLGEIGAGLWIMGDSLRDGHGSG